MIKVPLLKRNKLIIIIIIKKERQKDRKTDELTYQIRETDFWFRKDFLFSNLPERKYKQTGIQ